MNYCGSFSCYAINRERMQTGSITLLQSYYQTAYTGYNKIMLPQQFPYKKGSIVGVEMTHAILNTNCTYSDFLLYGTSLYLITNVDGYGLFFNVLIDTSFYLNIIDVRKRLPTSESNAIVYVNGNFVGSNNSITRALRIKNGILIKKNLNIIN